VSDPKQQHDPNVALSGFDLRDVAPGNVRLTGKLLSRHAAKGPHFAHAIADLGEKAAVRIWANATPERVASVVKPGDVMVPDRVLRFATFNP
jgi:hypothetical protein